ncbi:MAG: leucyl/phenylalanyl-tRNA--protein transferase, partial [Luteibaculum sp.]
MLWLEDELEINFPYPGTVQEEYPGLIAAGGNLLPNNLISAYKKGLFPWYSEGEPILWWSPDPRMILLPEKVRKQAEVIKILEDPGIEIRINSNPEAIIRACATVSRKDQMGTWINEDIVASYSQLAKENLVYCIGLYENHYLQAGLYGLKIGSIFFGESMFTRISNGSKACLVWLCEHLKNEIS